MLEATLQSLGFAEKEVKTYLVALAHGPLGATDIQRETALPRATLYLQLTSLEGRGLLAAYEEAGRTLYRAAPPEKLLDMLRQQREAIERKEAAVRSIVPELKSLSPDARLPKVKLYEGLDGLEALRQELLKYQGIEWYTLTGTDAYHGAVPPDRREAQSDRLWKNSLRGKVILSGLDEKPFPEPIKYLFERYMVPPDKYPVPGEVAIFEDKIVLLSYRNEPVGMLIQNADMSAALRSLFQLAFAEARRYKRVDQINE